MTVVEIFDAAVEVPEAEREAFLQQACGGDETLLRKVRALLRAHDRTSHFLDRPLAVERPEGGSDSPIGEKVGDQIGRYKLLQQIGEGGWGVVFMAEQEKPIRRQVALKIVKPGMDTKNVIARFEAERQALALMDHTNIAHIYDAGATDSGRPYFVMELIRGVKVTDYCDQHSLTTAARLELFAVICDAVQHAHQKGIIHRDIKPSNILVTATSDGQPIPKVIDFGIAKATTNQRLTDKTLFTAFEMLIGTPAYMSPEQAAFASVDVDTRSDIYSLGVLLYELLTGKTPFDTRELLKTGLDEVRRVIQTKTPSRPSTRLIGMGSDELTAVCLRRHAEPPKLIRQLRGDLDCIVMKSIEKDRALRFPTANAFAMEIRRYLAGELVLARPPSPAYRLRKLFAQHKLLLSGVSLLVVGLIALLAFMGVLLAREKELRENAEVVAAEGLTHAYVQDGKPELAEATFLRGLEIQRRRNPDYLPPVQAVDDLMWALLYMRKFDKAEVVINGLLAHGSTKSTNYVALMGLSADVLARSGRWAKAQAHAEKALAALPYEVGCYHRLAPLMVANHDIEGYQGLCHQIISRNLKVDSVFAADQLAKDCLILPSSGIDPKVVVPLVEFAITNGKSFSVYPYFQCCKALVEYRQQHYEEAAKWAQDASMNSYPYSQAEAFAILSMARVKLRAPDAKLVLDKCAEIIKTQLPVAGFTDLGTDWRDWIIVHALFDEATNLANAERQPGF